MGGGAGTNNCWALLWNTMVGRNKEKNKTEKRRKEENEDGSITKMESSQSPDDDTNK